MIVLDEKSFSYRLLKILSAMGEIPYSELHLLGRRESCRKTVLVMSKTCLYLNPKTKEKIECTAVVVSGSQKKRIIRLSKKSYPILEWIGGLDFYTAFVKNRITYVKMDGFRNIRLVQSLAVMQNAGIKFLPPEIPGLVFSGNSTDYDAGPSFYYSKYIKSMLGDEQKKNSFSRAVGMLIYPNQAYAVYNTIDRPISWEGGGEYKTRLLLQRISRLNGGSKKLSDAIVLGTTYDIALETLKKAEEERKDIRKSILLNSFQLDSIYQSLFFVEHEGIGPEFLKIMTVPGWRDILKSLFFSDEEIENGVPERGYDAIVDGMYTLFFMDNDIAKIERFALSNNFCYRRNRCQVYCFTEQEELIKNYLGDVNLKTAQFRHVYDCFFESDSGGQE